jgi:biotin carboxylase
MSDHSATPDRITPQMPGRTKRLLILASKLGYQTRSFAESAQRLGVEVVFGTDRCDQLDDPWQDEAIPLHFEDPQKAAGIIQAHAQQKPMHAILALGDRPTVTAAYAARALGLSYNSPHSVENCRNKLHQRKILSAARLPVPEFFAIRHEEDPSSVLANVPFPCVIKPLVLAAGQGVIRANNAEEFVAAVGRIRALLQSPEIQVTREDGLDRLLVERYIPGQEVAVEGLIDDAHLRLLAVFDKPDPLEGPFFEETLYVTPSRLPGELLVRIADCAARIVRALGLKRGPLHAEFRVNEQGPWVLEAAPRPIGGLCARALRFGPQKISLEELLVRHALGFWGADLAREVEASGVMMIPVRESGVLERVEGVEEAKATPGVYEVQITARLHDYVAAWPEGSSYLGFIFARGPKPEQVEAMLRQAHGKLRLSFTPRLPVEHPVTRRVASS